jgi:hypothetical protein
MNPNRKFASLLALVNLVFTLGIAFGSEILKEWLQDRSHYFLVSPDTLYGSHVVLTFITGAAVVWLVWFFLHTPSISNWIAGIYFIVGLYIILTPILLAKDLPVIRWYPLFPPPVIGFDSLFYFSGAVVTVLGLYRLISRLRTQKMAVDRVI